MKVFVKNDQSSKLEEKKKRIQVQNTRPTITKTEEASDMDKESLNFSKRQISDIEETPTGVLDDEITSPNEEETPTGFLDDAPVKKPSQERKKLVVNKINSEEYIKQQNQRPNDNVGTSEVKMRHPARKRQSIENNRESSEGNNIVVPESDKDTPPIRKEDKEIPKVPSPKKSGLSKILIVILVIMVLAVIGVAVVNVMIGYNTESSVAEEQSEIRAYLDGMYTDENHTDIKEDVTVDDISNVLNMLDNVRNTETYDTELFSELVNEVSTISFFIQDRSIYNDLVNGVYEVGSESYMGSIETLKSDIACYTVSGLASTMSSRVSILEASGGVGIGSVSQDESMVDTNSVIPETVLPQPETQTPSSQNSISESETAESPAVLETSVQ